MTDEESTKEEAAHGEVTAKGELAAETETAHEELDEPDSPRGSEGEGIAAAKGGGAEGSDEPEDMMVEMMAAHKRADPGHGAAAMKHPHKGRAPAPVLAAVPSEMGPDAGRPRPEQEDRHAEKPRRHAP